MQGHVRCGLTSVGAQPTVLSPEGKLASYRMVAEMNCRRDGVGDARDFGVRAFEDFIPESGVTASEAGRESALVRLSEKLADEVFRGARR